MDEDIKEILALQGERIKNYGLRQQISKERIRLLERDAEKKQKQIDYLLDRMKGWDIAFEDWRLDNRSKKS